MEKGLSSLPSILKRRALPALVTFAAVIGGAIAYLQITPRLYQTSTRLMLDQKRVSVSELGRDLTQLSSGTPGGSNPLADQAELIKSQRVLQKALTEVAGESGFSSPENELTVDQLSQGLKVKIVPATNILEVSYLNEDPILATKVVNAVSRAMVEDNTQVIRQEAANVRKFLEKKVPDARKRLQEAEQKENRYRQSSGIVSFDEQTKSIVESLATLEEQENTLSAQLQELRSKEASLQQVTDAKALNQAYAAVRGGQDEELKALRNKLAQIETQLVQARLSLTDNHPTVMNLLGQRNGLRALYQQGLARVSPTNQSISSSSVAGDQISQDLTSQLIVNDVERLAVENKLKVVQTNRANLQARLAQLPIKQQQLTPLTRQREESAESLKLLQSKLEEARIAEAQLVGNIQIIEAAQPPNKPSLPNKRSVLAIATLFGTALATGIVLLLELMDHTLKDASEAEELLKLPLLGVLPRLPSHAIALEPSARFLEHVGLVEPYRTLFKNLEFRSRESLRSIVVSSTITGEGKSVVASHLAVISAMLSRRTLLIDADLRRPILHTLFNLAPQPGITDVIDSERSLEETVQQTNIANLCVLTCGELYGYPSRLLESNAMSSLLAKATQQYDCIILDTPPLSACADAQTLGRQSNGILLVTRPGFTIKEVLKRAVSELTHNQIPIIGVVVNGMTNQTEQYYRYPLNRYRSLSSRSISSNVTRNS
ncbi:polysaccharide biosynthesis tyrosine autokinase [Fischerella sp. JS2]|uniref:GumC family protein n=1 Tax=Fischerella sp. JS2 TaxID=2597771 RepID=UPI0028EAAC32|nr:polysaccharide biosynthesis tyrosine autokinase [Fischerella sp. JS2]